MKKIEQRNYCSTNDFVGTNNLQSEAVKLFGKDWEAEDDVSQIERLLEEVGAKHFTVTHQEYVKSDYDLEVVFSDDLKEIADLKETVRLLTERLNATSCAIDTALDYMKEMRLDMEDSEAFVELFSQHTSNEIFFKSMGETSGRVWIDEGSVESHLNQKGAEYTDKEEVLKLIRSILKEDESLMEVEAYKDISKISEHTLFEIGFNHYSIYEK